MTVKLYHIYSSVQKGYEIWVEGAGHKRLMNISPQNPDGGGRERYTRPEYLARNLTRLIAGRILVHCRVVTTCILRVHVFTSCNFRFIDSTIFVRPLITDCSYSCFTLLPFRTSSFAANCLFKSLFTASEPLIFL